MKSTWGYGISVGEWIKMAALMLAMVGCVGAAIFMLVTGSYEAPHWTLREIGFLVIIVFLLTARR